MDDGRGRERLSFLGRRLPGQFELRTVVVASDGERVFDDAEWRDALVVVERGQIELECLGDTRWRFERGDVLWLMGLSVRTIRNVGHGPAVLVAVSRRFRAPGDQFRAKSPSQH
jgi:quercetin dioxygenase-like cupin family protein